MKRSIQCRFYIYAVRFQFTFWPFSSSWGKWPIWTKLARLMDSPFEIYGIFKSGLFSVTLWQSLIDPWRRYLIHSQVVRSLRHNSTQSLSPTSLDRVVKSLRQSIDESGGRILWSHQRYLTGIVPSGTRHKSTFFRPPFVMRITASQAWKLFAPARICR